MDSQFDLNHETRLLAQLQVPVWLFDAERIAFIWANAEGLKLWGASTVDDLVRRDVVNTLSPVARERLEQYREDLAVPGASIRESWTFYPNGEPLACEAVATAHRVSNGQAASLLIHVPQLTGKADSDTLYRANSLLHTRLMVSVYASQGELIYGNPAARRTIGKRVDKLQNRFADRDSWNLIQQQLFEHARVEVEARVHTVDGVRWHSLQLERCPDPISGDQSTLVSESDITDRREAQGRVHELAYTDPLTGLGNRRSMFEQLDCRIQEASKIGARVAVLYLDLDRFKLINDSLGHAVGDGLLVSIAERLKERISSEAFIARPGGDEFAIVISDPAPGPDDETVDMASRAEALAERIRVSLDSDLEVAGHVLKITPSIGIACHPMDGQDANSLVRSADLAMYTAKRAALGQLRFSPAMEQRASERLSLESDLLSAIRHRQFEVHFQPRLSIEDMQPQVSGAEALLRWRHPERGMIPPDVFVALAEEIGVVSDLTEIVLETALQQLDRWHTAGHWLSVSVNLSPIDLQSDRLIKLLARQLGRFKDREHLIELEITESMLMDGANTVMSSLQRIKDLGVRLAIDDFGTGYSNLGYLHRFPIDCLKIDRSFVNDPERDAVLAMIATLGKQLNLRLVAEGVETEEELQRVSALHCEEVQGFLFSAPLRVDAFQAYVEQTNGVRTRDAA